MEVIEEEILKELGTLLSGLDAHYTIISEGKILFANNLFMTKSINVFIDDNFIIATCEDKFIQPIRKSKKELGRFNLADPDCLEKMVKLLT